MGNSARRGTVTEEHREESARLKRLWEQAEHGLSQEAFGATYGIGNQSAVWQFLNGRTALSLEAAKGFAKGLGCDIAAFSPRLAGQAADLASVTHRQSAALSFLDLKRDEAVLIGLYRDLDPEQKSELQRFANEMHVKARPVPSIANPFPHAPPVAPEKRAPRPKVKRST